MFSKKVIVPSPVSVSWGGHLNKYDTKTFELSPELFAFHLIFVACVQILCFLKSGFDTNVKIGAKTHLLAAFNLQV